MLPAVRFLNRTTPPHILTLVLMAGLGALSMNIFLPSLPVMAEYFGAEYRLVQLSVSLYLGVNALLQIFIGPISDRFGRRPVMLGAIGIFLVATAGTIFERTRNPLRTWFAAMWFVTSQKDGASALGLKRVLGLGSYQTAWEYMM